MSKGQLKWFLLWSLVTLSWSIPGMLLAEDNTGVIIFGGTGALLLIVKFMCVKRFVEASGA